MKFTLSIFFLYIIIVCQTLNSRKNNSTDENNLNNPDKILNNFTETSMNDSIIK